MIKLACGMGKKGLFLARESFSQEPIVYKTPELYKKILKTV